MKRSSYKEYDIIVIGAGHAGCEAALAAARMGRRTIMMTIDMAGVALMPCNPSIGGIGKGQLVREIDALGGEMGRNIDATNIQMKTLNSSKGPAVQALRAQADKRFYEKQMRQVLQKEEKLELIQDTACRITRSGNKVTGVVTGLGKKLQGRAVVVTAGTFLNGIVTVGKKSFQAGRMGEDPANDLSASLKECGLELGRFQTATPPRVDRRSLNLSLMAREEGDSNPLYFSSEKARNGNPNIPCYLTYTNKKTRAAVKKNLHLSPIKTGAIVEHGPRNCPSIERKIINFPDKSRHPVFVEPEGLETTEMYLQGLTTAMPVYAQTEIIRTVAGLEEAILTRPGYAVAYDIVLPDQLRPSLETKVVGGLFTAGQINGTTGYEEAAAQGLIAGINAALLCDRKKPVVLKRSTAYIGVLIDDLITKSVVEPYRMYTSRAEFRLLLRNDNADRRLAQLGHELGLVSKSRLAKVKQKQSEAERLLEIIDTTSIRPSKEINRILSDVGETPIERPVRLRKLLRRPKVTFSRLAGLMPEFLNLDRDVVVSLEMEIKYEGYIEREKRKVARFNKLEDNTIPGNLDYGALAGISFEARERLTRVRPGSLGQAARISGVSPADISLLAVHLERCRHNESRL